LALTDFRVSTAGAIIVLEDLKNIRKKSFGKSFNRMLHTWSFFRLKNYIEYKAKILGIKVELIDPRFTSQECSSCGFIAKSNRKTQNRFKCGNCGFELHADLNGSRNIASRFLKTLDKGIAFVDGELSISPCAVA